MYYLISCINEVVNSFLLKDGKILTAKEQFDMDKPFTKDKHDTHLKSTLKDYTILNDLNSDNLNISKNKTGIK